MFGLDPSIGSAGRSVFVEPLVLGVFLLGDLAPSWDFNGRTLSSLVYFVNSFLSQSSVLLTMPLSTLVDSAVPLMDLSLSATIRPIADSKSTDVLPACLSLTVCRNLDLAQWAGLSTAALSSSKDTFLPTVFY